MNPDRVFTIPFEGEDQEEDESGFDWGPVKKAAFEKVWRDCADRIWTRQRERDDAAFHDLCSFVHNYQAPELRMFPNLILDQPLPTAVILGSAKLSKIRKRLKVSTPDGAIPPLVVHIQHQHFGTVKNALKQVICAFIGASDEDDEDEVPGRLVRGRKTSYLSTDNIALLEAWYRTKCTDEQRPKLVIVFEDFEAFDAQVLSTFLEICSSYRSRLPFVCIFQIATSLEAIESLSWPAKAKLRINPFQLHDALDSVDEAIIEAFCTEDAPFTISADTAASLQEGLVVCNNSRTALLGAIKYVHLLHCYQSPWSGLADADEGCPAHERAILLRTAPSYRKHVARLAAKAESEGLDEVEAAFCATLTDDDELFARLEDAKTSFRNQRIARSFALRLYTTVLEPNSKGKRNADTLDMVLGIDLLAMALRKTKVLRSAADETMATLLEAILELQAEGNTQEQNAFFAEIENDQSELQGLFEQLKRVKNRQHLMNNNASPSKKGFQTGHKPTALDNDFSLLVGRVCVKIDTLFKSAFEPYEDLLFHELLIFDQGKALQRALRPQPQLDITSHLHRPKIRNLASDNPVDALDASILYNNIQEAGKLINLGDWLEAFSTSVQEHTDKRTKGKRKRDDIEDESATQARFVRGVSEMAAFGLIAATKRKTEHVARAIW